MKLSDLLIGLNVGAVIGAGIAVDKFPEQAHLIGLAWCATFVVSFGAFIISAAFYE